MNRQPYIHTLAEKKIQFKSPVALPSSITSLFSQPCTSEIPTILTLILYYHAFL